MTSPPSMERIYPGHFNTEAIAGHATLELHLQRYHFAGKHLVPGVVADIACGSGYGSYCLATEYLTNKDSLLAVDNSKEAISYAKEHYSHPRIEFVHADAMQFSTTAPINTIVSLETIEHLPQPAAFVQHLTTLLAQGGRFIASAPITPSMDANPYHLHDFTKKSFRRLFTEAGLTEVNSMIQIQRYNPFSLLKKKEGRTEDIRQGLAAYYLRHPAKMWLRFQSILKDGFCNKYLVVVFEKK